MIDPAADAVHSVLSKLRTRTGLSADRLDATEVGVEALTELPVVRQQMTRTGAERNDAVVDTVREYARQLDPADMVVADAALALKLLDADTAPDIELDQLYAADLGRRREYLAKSWRQLLENLHSPVEPATMSERSLRSSREARAFALLANLLVSAQAPTTTARAQAGKPTVVVVGDALMDHVYRVGALPSADSYTEGAYIRRPGGKGLNQAVAAARLGLDVRLVSAIGDDESGSEILQYLAREGVDTGLVKIVAGVATPANALVVDRFGKNLSIACTDDRVRLSGNEIHGSGLRAALELAAAVLVTFESTVDNIAAVLTMLENLKTPPAVVVHPSPPRPAAQLYNHFRAIDYVIGTPGELTALVANPNVTDAEAAANLVRALGVGTVCITDGFTCRVRREPPPGAPEAGLIEIDRFAAALVEAPGARDAFAAALARRIAFSDDDLARADFEWATAAMFAAQSVSEIAEAMPDLAQVQRVVDLPAFSR